MVHIGWEELSVSSEVIIILWLVVKEQASVLRSLSSDASHMYYDCEAEM